MSAHNTILKLRGLQEWIAVTEGAGIHLTGEPGNAFIWTAEDAQTIMNHWSSRYNTPLQPLPVKSKLNGHKKRNTAAHTG